MTHTVYQVYPSAVPAYKVLYLRWILGHKIVEKVKFDTSGGVPTKARVSSKILRVAEVVPLEDMRESSPGSVYVLPVQAQAIIQPPERKS